MQFIEGLLDAGRWAQAGTYPSVAGSIPVLMEDPEEYLRQQRRLLAEEEEALLQRADRYRELADRVGWRRETFRSCVEGLEQNRQLLQRLQALLAEFPGDSEAPDDPFFRHPPLVGALTRDWGGNPVAESEGERLRDAIVDSLDEMSGDRGTALLVGGGAGRMAGELLARFDRVIALDPAFALPASFSLLRKGPFCISRVEQHNLRSADQQRQEAELRIPRDRRDAEGLDFVVADPRRTPFSTGAFETVILLNASRRWPIPPLMPEVGRLLATGGTLVHASSFIQIFEDVGQQLSALEVMELCRISRFEVGKARWVDVFVDSSFQSLIRKRARNLVFAAAKL